MTSNEPTLPVSSDVKLVSSALWEQGGALRVRRS